MRSDKRLPETFRDESQWIIDPVSGEKKPEFERFKLYGTEFHKHSYSGYERNKLFLNIDGSDFTDISGISGADEIADSRSWGRWDFDKDGRTDIAVVNANKPLLSWFRNTSVEAKHHSENRFIALKFQGANHSTQPSPKACPRDGYGARVVVQAGGLRMEREHVCGEGYASQNSATLLVGIGDASEATIKVHWPSGMVTGPKTVKAESLALCRESKGERGFETMPYAPRPRQPTIPPAQ